MPLHTKFRKCTETKSGNIALPASRMLYPNLFEPRLRKGEKDPKKAKYEVVALIPKEADVSMLVETQEETRDAKWTAKAQRTLNLKMPLLKTSDNKRFAAFAEDFPYYVSMKSKTRPQVIQADKTPVTVDDEDTEIYNGRWFRPSVDCFPYDLDESKGVAFGMQNIQLLDHDEVLSGGRAAADDDFDAAVDEEVGDMEDADI